MEQNTNTSKISYAKNLNKINFNVIISASIDSNVNVKNILNINSFIYDQKIECGNGKAFLSGKIGTKIIYIDTDNMTNTLTQSQTFNETYLDNLITNETYLNISCATITNTVLSADNIIKISCDVNISPVAYINLAIANELEKNEDLISKNSEIKTNSISNIINAQFEHSSAFEIKETISKILCSNASFATDKIISRDGYVVVEGRMFSQLLYEVNTNEEVVIKEIKNVENIKYDVEIANLTNDEVVDATIMIDKFNETVNIEIENETSIVNVKNQLKVCGVSLKPISISLVDDLYSTKNQIETTTTKREFSKNAEQFTLSEIISNDLTLSNDETAIDEIVSNLNITPEITNTYIKDGNIYLEGIVASNLIFVDENKEIQHKQVEIPFIINSNVHHEALDCYHNDATVIDSKVKVKRGTILEMEYSLLINLSIYEKETHEMIDNFTIGKQLDFSKYDFQIYIAKPNETLWQLCKRINISPDEIHKYNKDLPLVMEGGEKVVIKR